MPFRAVIDRGFRDVIEAVVLVLVILSPWTFGAVEPVFEFLLYVGIALLLVLWAGRMLCQGQFTWKKCPVALCLAAFFVLGVGQLQPLPRPALNFLSPPTVRLFDELLPTEPEKPLGESYQRPALAAGTRLSLYPGATRRELVRLLAVFLLFAVVRNNICSPEQLRRLFLTLVVNGCALAFFALIQFFTSPRDTVYWTYQTKGSVFGPFISRTHYPFYLNVCIGAGLGLLVVPESRRQGSNSPIRELLDDPPRLWLGFALALMIGSVALSMSRGGILALLSGFAVLVLLLRVRFARLVQVGTALLAVAAAVALVSWLGGQRVEARLATIWKGEAMQHSRLPLWTDSWPLVLEFPFLGTGFGTFAYAEPLHRQHTLSIFIHEHAHNEFLEALVEGGVVRLALSLVTIGLVFRLGLRAVRQGDGKPAGGLALGALFGFTTLVVHSIGDFGLHLPAIAVLATVLCAQLVALGQDDPANSYVLRAKGLAPAGAALTLLVMALVLCTEGRRIALVQAYRQTAMNLQGTTDPADQDRQLALLTAAERLMPDSGRLVSELAQAHLTRFQLEQARWNARLAGQLVLAGAASSSRLVFAGVGESPSAGLAVLGWDAAMTTERSKLERKHLLPALRAFLQARDDCPLMAGPQLQLALHHPHLKNAGPRSAYLDRAKRAVTNDPDHWFLFGLVEYLEGQYPRAAQSWRRYLELSDRYLPTIVQLGSAGFGPESMARDVLPDRPELLVDIAENLYPRPEQAAQRRPYLDRAMTVLRDSPGPSPAANLFLRGRIYALLGQSEEALKDYRQALAQEPRQPSWHIELAKLFRAQGRWSEAREELMRGLALQPGNPKAAELLAEVNRQLNEANSQKQ